MDRANKVMPRLGVGHYQSLTIMVQRAGLEAVELIPVKQEEPMSSEICNQCGDMMTEQPSAYETVNLAGAPQHSARFYEQWFVCGNGHRKGYISGHGSAPGEVNVISRAGVVTLQA